MDVRVRSTARQLAALTRDVGGGHDHLPWATPREAAGALSPAGRGALRAARSAIRDAWLTPEPHRALAEGFAALDPRSRCGVFPGAPPGGPRWMLNSLASGVVTDAPIKNQAELPSTRLYNLRGEDPFANLPVTSIPMIRANVVGAADPFKVFDAVLIPNDAMQQLRMVTYERGAVTMYTGWYRSVRAPRFGLDEHARMLALRPAIRWWCRVARAIGPRPLGDAALVEVLSALREPALLARRGRIVFANRSGAALASETKEWLRSGCARGFADIAPLAPGGLDLELILPDVSRASQASSEETLAHKLSRIAESWGLTEQQTLVLRHLATGAANKEVAQALECHVRTIEDHVGRILRRANVSSRARLLSKLREA